LIIVGVSVLFLYKKVVTYPGRRFVGVLSIIIGIILIITSYY
jgi:hypothetical protein